MARSCDREQPRERQPTLLLFWRAVLLDVQPRIRSSGYISWELLFGSQIFLVVFCILVVCLNVAIVFARQLLRRA